MLNKFAMFVVPLVLAASSITFASPDEYEEEYGARGPMSFNAMDLNQDGVITPQEHAMVRKERQSYREKQGYPMRNKDNAPAFNAIDRDGDGAINADEWSNWHQYRSR